MQIKYRFLILLLSSLFLFVGCASKRNTGFTRQWSAFTTRYNVYFNGHEAYKESLKQMENSFEDNYSEQLFMHPVSALSESDPTQNFERAIEKSQKAIKLRSMPKRPPRSRTKKYDDEYKAFLNRKEFNPFLHNAWMLMGKSEYYQGDFLTANATFQYITRHFSWLPETVQEARIWAAKCYAEMGWIYEAENMMQQVDSTQIAKEAKQPYHEAMMLLCLKREQPDKAIVHLEEALKTSYSKAQKARMQFLLGQLYRMQDDPIRAYAMFGKVIRMNPSYRTLFNAQIAQTEVMPLSSQEKIAKRLAKMARDPRNKDYLDQVYYAQGNLALHQKDTLKAIQSYQNAVDKSTRGQIEKAIAAIRLGDLTFAQEDYLKAQPAYAAAISILTEKHKEYERVSHLSGVLDNLAIHAQTVHLQDSLLHLAALPEAEQLKVIQQVIDNLIESEKKAQEEALRDAYENNKGNYDRPGMTGPPQPSINNGDNSWYFYNKMALTSGRTEFQRKWGVRKPEDNWRRRDKSATLGDNFAFESVMDEDESEEGVFANADSIKTPTDAATDPKNPAYYLNQLPLTPEAKQQANLLIEDAVFNMGVIFNQQLDNLPLAIKTMLNIEERYPTSERLLDVYYEVYLMYMRQNKVPQANLYKDKLIAMFANSPYAVALSDPNYVQKMREMQSKQNALYEETYAAYLAGDTKKVHDNYAFVKQKWPLSELMPQFLFLHALSYVNEGKTELFKQHIEELTALHSESPVGPLAGEMMTGLQAGRDINPSNGVTRGMIWEAKINISGAEGEAINSTANNFSFHQDAPHLMVLAYPSDSIQSNELLFEVAKYNFTNYLVKDFDLETITFDKLSMLIIKGFNNFDELSKYRLRMSLPQGLKLPSVITPVMISDENFRLLLQGRSFDDYFTFINECTEQELLNQQQ